MTVPDATPSARRAELIEAAYGYVLSHGLVGVSLRPLAAAIGSSPRVLLYLFGSKDGLVRALLARAQPPGERDTPAGLAGRTLDLAVLRGALLDLLATGDEQRTTAAVEHHLATVNPNSR